MPISNNNDYRISVETTFSNKDSRNTIEGAFKAIRIFAKLVEQKNFKQLPKNLPATIKIERKKFFASPIYRRQLIENYTEFKLKDYYDCANEEMLDDDLLFVTATQLEPKNLETVIKRLSIMGENQFKKIINQTRDEDSVIVFLLKYSTVSRDADKFKKCIEILVNAGVDVKKYDIKGKSAIDYISSLYVLLKRHSALKQTAILFLEKGVFNITNLQTLDNLNKEMKIDLERYRSVDLDEKTLLYLDIINNNHEELKKSDLSKQLLNETDRENTFLQLACKISDNNLNTVNILLDSGADPNLTTQKNPTTPLEMAGRRNFVNIFQALLNDKSTVITEEQYRNFVKMRGSPMKSNLFEMLLLSKKLNVDYKTERTKNIPLHYAIFFNHKKAIQHLLQRGSSLHATNENGKCALDVIEMNDLQKYFDWCIAKDKYKETIEDLNYQLFINFTSLINEEQRKELQVVTQMTSSTNLRQLLLHPLIHILISLKWSNCQKYFYLMVFLQGFLFMIMSLYFYFFIQLNLTLYIFGLIVIGINILIKLLILLNFDKRKFYMVPKLRPFTHAPLHSVAELLVIVTSLFIVLLSTQSFCSKQIRSFIFIEMSICFLLTCGYHPNLSKWSIMLQRVFKTFTILFLFFSLFIIAFAMGFHILFEKDEEQQLFSNYSTSIFKTFIMMTGEFDVNEVTFDSGIAGFLIFLLFTMFMSLVIVNFWTGVAVTDIEKIEKDSELNAFKNVMVFLNFVDILYSKNNFISTILKRICGNPDLFIKNEIIIDEKEKPLLRPNLKRLDRNAKKFAIHFYINRDVQIKENDHPNLPKVVDNVCLEKIKSYCNEPSKSPEIISEEILNKLNEIPNILSHLKALEKKLEALSKVDGKESLKRK